MTGIDKLTAYVGGLLTAGFLDYGETVDAAMQCAEESGDTPPGAAVDVVRRMWSERLAVQESWPDTGDYGRLQRAFDELQTAGVVARMCFSCCLSCGHLEIAEELTPDPTSTDESHPFREWGYTFFHRQDAWELENDSATLFLAFGTFAPERSESELGQQLVDTLRRQGLHTSWSGSPYERIALDIREWRKPLPVLPDP